MNHEKDNPFILHLPARLDYLPVAVQYVETTAVVFGLGRDEALKLSLATEEIFVYLGKTVCPGAPIAIECENGLYYIRVQFRFTVSTFNLKGLNITSAMAGGDEASLEDMGLMIASRSVDRLTIEAGKRNETCLVIEKEKDYPRAPEVVLPLRSPGSTELLPVPDAENLKQFAVRVARSQPDYLRPLYFDYPGKVVDMVAGGEYQAIVAAVRGAVTGGILFHFQTDRIVELFGPYVFDAADDSETSKRLLDACLMRIARTRALGIMSLGNLPPSLAPDFEPLGVLSYSLDNGETIECHARYRFLHEDPGCTVWTHAALHDYLEREYRRLVLARDIQLVQDLGETRQQASILSTELRRVRATATLRPLWPGHDFNVNVERHIRFLQEEGIRNIFFELDLGVPWHASLIPVLLANQFRPELILPFAGQADMAVFQYHAPSRS